MPETHILSNKGVEEWESQFRACNHRVGAYSLGAVVRAASGETLPVSALPLAPPWVTSGKGFRFSAPLFLHL